MSSTTTKNPEDTIFSIRILSTNKDIGKLIGEHGKEIAAIRESCNAVLHISELSKGIRERILTVRGNNTQINNAVKQICNKFASDSVRPTTTTSDETPVEHHEEKPSNPDAFVFILLLPVVLTGRVIGKGGEKINSIKQDSGATIVIANDPLDNTTERKVTFTGTVEAVVKAATPIINIISENSFRLRDMHMIHYTPGAPFNSSNGSAHAQLPAHINAAVAAAVAKSNFNNKGKTSTRDTATASNSEQILTIQINVPATSIGSIIGHQGNNIRDIRRRSGAEITIAANSVGDERSIMIKGNLQQNEMALFLIQSTLANAPPRRTNNNNNSNKEEAPASTTTNN